MISILHSLLAAFALLLVLIADHNAMPSSGGNGSSLCDFATNQFVGCQEELTHNSVVGSGASFDPCGQKGIYCDEKSHVVGIHINDASIAQLESIPQSVTDEYSDLLWLRIDVPLKSIYNEGIEQSIDRDNWIKSLCILDIDSTASSVHECQPHSLVSLKEASAVRGVCSYNSMESSRCSASLIEDYFRSKYKTHVSNSPSTWSRHLGSEPTLESNVSPTGKDSPRLQLHNIRHLAIIIYSH
jgi:hypothetical protein